MLLPREQQRSMESDKTINVEVAYALPETQRIISLEVNEGTELIDAVKQSGILEEFSGIDIEKAKVGIFGKLKKANTVLREGDRVEIYRKLIADPKQVRKERAEQGKQMRKGSGTIKVKEDE